MKDRIIWTNIKVKLRELIAWDKNPRHSTKEQAQKIIDSFDEFGQVQAVAVSPFLEVYDGHQRLSALLALHGGDYEIDARQSSRALTDEERKKLVILLHAGAQGAWDWDILSGWDKSLLIDNGLGKEWLSQNNFDVIAVKKMLGAIDNKKEDDVEPQIDKGEELRLKWDVERGQLWQLGKHRLMCGDSTSAEDMSRLMREDKIRTAVTSPPYSDQREYKTGAFNWLNLANGFFAVMIPHLENACDVLVNLGMSYKSGEVDFYWNDWLVECKRVGYPLFGFYVWDKMNGKPGDWHGRLAPAHEFIFHFSKGNKSANKWIETKTENNKTREVKFRRKDGSLKDASSLSAVGQALKIPDSVIRLHPELSRGIHTQVHPAVYPVQFASFLIETWSNPTEIIYEPFSGSGSTLIACEQLQRKCRAMEIAPEYVAVTLQRYLDATGRYPVKTP